MRTDPFVPNQTKSNRFGILNSALLVFAVWTIGESPTAQQLNQTWTVRVEGQSSPVTTAGTFRIANIASADQTGPGSQPDFKSDRFFILTGVGKLNGVQTYVQSAPFQITQGEPFLFGPGDLTFLSNPPDYHASMTVALVDVTLNVAGQTTQAIVIGLLLDGVTTVNLTGEATGTNYVSSNPNTATVDKDGLVTAVGDGVAFITASNYGVTAVDRVTVSLGDPGTTVVGLALFADGTPAVGANVVVLGQGLTTISGPDGSFSIPGVLAETGNLYLRAETIVGADTHRGSSGNLPPVGGQMTDAGLVMLDLLDPPRAVYVNNNDPAGNTVAAYSVMGDGTLVAQSGSPFSTGGTGATNANRDGAATLTPEGSFLFVTNTGTDDISSFSVASSGDIALVPGCASRKR